MGREFKPWVYTKLPAYAQLARPFTLIAPFFAGVFGALAPLKSFGFEEFKVAIYVGVTLALLQAAGQVINQYADAELDRFAKPYRPIPSGRVSRDEALGLGVLLLIAGLARGFLVTPVFGVVCTVLAFMSVYYSLPPFSPRRVSALLNTAWLALARGFLPVVAVWSVYGDVYDSIPYATVATVWVLAFQPTKDIGDAVYDTMFGVKTIPNTYGLKWFRRWCVANTVLLVTLILLFRLYVFTLLVPLAIFNIIALGKTSKLVENNLAWAGFYTGLAVFYVLLFANTRLEI